MLKKGIMVHDMSRGRRIILVQDIAISAMLTKGMLSIMYPDMHGIRLAIVVVAGFTLFFRTLEDLADEILRGKNNDKSRRNKGDRNTVPGVPWSEVRYKDVISADRDCAKHAAKVQKAARPDSIRQID